MNYINIQFDATKNINSRIEIYDNTGRLIYYNSIKAQIGNNLQTINIADYAKGLYHIIIKDKEHIESKKFEVK